MINVDDLLSGLGNFVHSSQETFKDFQPTATTENYKQTKNFLMSGWKCVDSQLAEEGSEDVLLFFEKGSERKVLRLNWTEQLMVYRLQRYLDKERTGENFKPIKEL